MATGRGGAGGVPPAQPRSPNRDPRPDPGLYFGAKIGPVPDPVGAPNSVGDPWGITIAASKVPALAHHDSKQLMNQSINLAKPLNNLTKKTGSFCPKIPVEQIEHAYLQ
jgi:hypothetical protein